MERTDDTKMLLTIIIPMYNAELYIGECLDSIFLQGLDETKFEILIINDGSTDKSEYVVNQYMLKYHNIRLFNQTNAGQSTARNRGIHEAQGQYVWFVDADDVIIPESVSRVFALIDNGDLLMPEMLTFGIQGGDLIGIHAFVEDKEPLVEESCTGLDYIAKHNYNNSPCYYFISKTYLLQNDILFKEGTLCEDGIFTLTALLNASNVQHLDCNVYYYVSRSNSTTSTYDERRKRQLIEGFVYAVQYITQLINEYQDRMPLLCLERVLTRRDSYAFFLLIRLLKLGDVSSVKEAIKQLKSDGIYPIKHFIGKDYNGVNLKLFNWMVNTPSLLYLVCYLWRMRAWSK